MVSCWPQWCRHEVRAPICAGVMAMLAGLERKEDLREVEKDDKGRMDGRQRFHV
jgi:hypothetical protein